MKRKQFLRTALLAIAVSLVPKILRPVENIFEAGESPVSEVMLIPKYDPTKSYKVQYLGQVHWFNGAALNYMENWEYERMKGITEKFLSINKLNGLI